MCVSVLEMVTNYGVFELGIPNVVVVMVQQASQQQHHQFCHQQPDQ
jgi:hypothetical protein